MRRFTYASKRLAKEIYKDFIGRTKAEYEDLVAIGLCAFCVSLKKFNHDGYFFSFWKQIAYHDMIEHIKRFSIAMRVEGEYVDVIVDDVDEWCLASDDCVSEEVWNSILINSALSVLQDPKYKFSKKDQAIFIYYLNGYSTSEISDMMGTGYHNIHSKIKRISGEIANILKYSNE